MNIHDRIILHLSNSSRWNEGLTNAEAEALNISITEHKHYEPTETGHEYTQWLENIAIDYIEKTYEINTTIKWSEPEPNLPDAFGHITWESWTDDKTLCVKWHKNQEESNQENIDYDWLGFPDEITADFSKFAI